LGRLILALKVNLKIFDEVLKPLLDVDLGENIVKPNLTLMTILPSKRKP
jgi:hypothetical protein